MSELCDKCGTYTCSCEFNLSEKSETNQDVGGPSLGNVYWEKDVKEFIRLLILGCPNNHSGINLHRCKYCRRIDKLAGKDLR